MIEADGVLRLSYGELLAIVGETQRRLKEQPALSEEAALEETMKYVFAPLVGKSCISCGVKLRPQILLRLECFPELRLISGQASTEK